MNSIQGSKYFFPLGKFQATNEDGSPNALVIMDGILDFTDAIAQFLPPPASIITGTISSIFKIFVPGPPSTEDVIKEEFEKQKKFIEEKFDEQKKFIGKNLKIRKNSSEENLKSRSNSLKTNSHNKQGYFLIKLIEIENYLLTLKKRLKKSFNSLKMI